MKEKYIKLSESEMDGKTGTIVEAGACGVPEIVELLATGIVAFSQKIGIDPLAFSTILSAGVFAYVSGDNTFYDLNKLSTGGTK